MINNHNAIDMVELDDNSLIGKVVSIFPLVFFLETLLYAKLNNSYMLLVLSLIFLIIGIWTLYAEGKILFNKSSREICRYKRWLWFRWTRCIPIDNYEFVNIISFAQEENTKSTYCVNIKKRGSSFLSVNDIRLKVFPAKNRDEAFLEGEKVALITGLEFVGEK